MLRGSLHNIVWKLARVNVRIGVVGVSFDRFVNGEWEWVVKIFEHSDSK